MIKIIKKAMKKIFSSFGIAALAAVFAIAGSVFAATNWSTWTADMTVADGDIMTVEKWNNMVNAVGELKTTTTNLTSVAGIGADTEVSLGNNVGYVSCLSSQVTTSPYGFWIDRTNKKVYVWGFNNYWNLGNNSTTNVTTKTENTWFSGKEVISISCAGNAHGALATIKESDGSTGLYVWGLIYYSGVTPTGYIYPWLTSITGMSANASWYGYAVPTKVTTF